MALDLTLAINNTTAASGTNTTITKPTSSAEGDLVIVYLYIEDDVAPSAPDGTWTLIASIDHTGQAMDLFAWYKVLVAGEAASWVFTHGATAWRQGGAYRITGAPTSSPLDGTATTNQGTSVTATATGLTTTQANSALVAITGWWDAGKAAGTGTLTSPLVERLDTTQFEISSGVQAAAGASGDKTIDISDTGTDEWFTIMFGVKDSSESPAAGGYTPQHWLRRRLRFLRHGSGWARRRVV